MFITIPNFLSRAIHIGYSEKGQFMTHIRHANYARQRGNYESVLLELNAAKRNLESHVAYKASIGGARHARVATAACMMLDIEKVIAQVEKRISDFA